MLYCVACSWPGIRVSERPFTVGELKTAHREHRLLEAFGAGTACVVQPISSIVQANVNKMNLEYDVKNQGALANRLSTALQDIQYGRVPHKWSVPFE